MLALGCLAVVIALVLEGCGSPEGNCNDPKKDDPNDPSSPPVDSEDPMWGCGLLGVIPGISSDGTVTADTARLIAGIKGSSSYNKVNYWNWNFVPDVVDPDLNKRQYLTKDFIFMPEMWGQGAADVTKIPKAGSTDYLLGDGTTSASTVANVFMGSNEPDIYGSCMGAAFGECLLPTCCWQYGNIATGVGFWPVAGCDGDQPLPTMWEDPKCIDNVMGQWQMTAAAARHRGYKYLSTPLVAFNISYAEQFIKAACSKCQTIECGCPQYVGFHFYAYDCQPVALGGYAGFQARLDEVADVMDRYPFIKGAIVNEVGMLNCQSSYQNPICIPDNGKYPASQQPDNACPVTEELPNGMASYVEKLFDMVINSKAKDGRSVVKAFSWFMLDKVGGTYNQKIFDSSGKLNKVGEEYISSCQRWEQATATKRMMDF